MVFIEEIPGYVVAFIVVIADPDNSFENKSYLFYSPSRFCYIFIFLKFNNFCFTGYKVDLLFVQIAEP